MIYVYLHTGTKIFRLPFLIFCDTYKIHHDLDIRIMILIQARTNHTGPGPGKTYPFQIHGNFWGITHMVNIHRKQFLLTKQTCHLSPCCRCWHYGRYCRISGKGGRGFHFWKLDRGFKTIPKFFVHLRSHTVDQYFYTCFTCIFVCFPSK